MSGIHSAELGEHESGPAPERHDFPTLPEYLLAWQIWRAARRDAWMTDEELASALAATEARLRARTEPTNTEE